MLVKIASGTSKNNKFAILKNNNFPSMSKISKPLLRDYIIKNRKKDNLLKYGDLNLLVFVAETVDIDTAMELGLCVAS